MRCSCDAIFVDGGSDYFRCGGFESVLVERDGIWTPLPVIAAENRARALEAQAQKDKEASVLVKTDQADAAALTDESVRVLLMLEKIVSQHEDNLYRTAGYEILKNLRQQLGQ